MLDIYDKCLSYICSENWSNAENSHMRLYKLDLGDINFILEMDSPCIKQSVCKVLNIFYVGSI